MRVLYKSPSCKPEDYSLIGRTAQDLDNVTTWAINNAHCEFGLGVLAAMNYVTCNDEKTPEERQGDPQGIRRAAEPPEWVKHYVKTFRPDLLPVAGKKDLAFMRDS